MNDYKQRKLNPDPAIAKYNKTPAIAPNTKTDLHKPQKQVEPPKLTEIPEVRQTEPVMEIL